MYLAHHMKASLVLYITDMPTTAAWLDHVYGTFSGHGELFRDQAVQSAVVEVVARHISNPDLTKSVTACSCRRVGQINVFRISIGELESSASLVLAQGNPLIMGGLRPVPPNLVYCGMMQCREAGPLPVDLQQFMDSATEGVVLVSFGSVLQGSQVSHWSSDLT